MPCTCPLDAWPPAPGSNDRRFVFSPQKSYQGAKPISFPCGRCQSCLLTRSRDWATRIIHEVKTAGGGCFLTLTYDQEHLPRDWSISIPAVQDFMKAVRYRFGPTRFFAVGEYGEQGKRPHYHIILFGLWPDDLKLAPRIGKSGEPLYTSPKLDLCWQRGEILVGRVTPESAGYVTRYSLKKAGGSSAGDPQYRRTAHDIITGEFREWWVKPVFAIMSRRPGIGAEWFARWGDTDLSNDYVIVKAQKRAVPRFYTDKLTARDQMVIGAKRKASTRKPSIKSNNTEARLLARTEFVKVSSERNKRGDV